MSISRGGERADILTLVSIRLHKFKEDQSLGKQACRNMGTPFNPFNTFHLNIYHKYLIHLNIYHQYLIHLNIYHQYLKVPS